MGGMRESAIVKRRCGAAQRDRDHSVDRNS